MRKGQEKLIQSAIKANYRDKYIEMLSDETLSIQTLKFIFDLLTTYQDEDISLDTFLLIENYFVDKSYLATASRLIKRIGRPLSEIINIIKNEDELTSIQVLTIFQDWCYLSKLTYKEIKTLYLQNADVCWKIGCNFYDCNFDYNFEICQKVMNLYIKTKEDNRDIPIKDIYCFVKADISEEVLIQNDFDYKKICLIKAKNFMPKTIEKILSILDNQSYALVHEPEVLEQFQNIKQYIKYPMSFTIHEQIYKLSYSASFNGFSIKIRYGTSSTFMVHQISDTECDYSITPNLCKNAIEYFFTYDGMVYAKTKIKGTEKWYPLNFKGFACATNNEILQIAIEEYIETQIQAGHYIWKDLEKYLYVQNPTCLPPIPINEILSYHTIDEMMKTHYKNANFVNCNKANLIWCFSLMKNINKYDEKTKNLLLSMKYEQKDAVFIPSEFLYNRLPVSTYWTDYGTKEKCYSYQVNDIILDYFDITRALHIKPSLCFKSAKKLKETHDRLSELYITKNAKTIKIPKNSKFNPLREKLPEQFEWIKTKSRLVHEGCSMHHCVVTYDKKINADKCAIYSVINPANGKRYTIEFCKSNKKYYIRQIYGMWNSMCPEEFTEYVESLL